MFYIFSNDEPNIGAWYNGKAVDATACKVNGVDSYSIFQPNAASSDVDEKVIPKIKELTGLPVGINLEPVDPNANA